MLNYSTSRLHLFVDVIAQNHGRHIRILSVGHSDLDDGVDRREREEVIRRILATLTQLEELYICGSTMVSFLIAPSSATLPPLPFSSSLRHFCLSTDEAVKMNSSQVASLLRLLPNIEHLKCTSIGESTDGESLRAVQSLGNLEALQLFSTDVVNDDFASSTGWTSRLERISIFGDHLRMNLDLIRGFLSNLPSSLVQLYLYVRQAPLHPLPAPLLLPHLTHLFTFAHLLNDLKACFHLAKAPVEILTVFALGSTAEECQPVVPLVRQLRKSLKKVDLVLTTVELGDGTRQRSAFFGSELEGELKEFCEKEGVELQIDEEERERGEREN